MDKDWSDWREAPQWVQETASLYATIPGLDIKTLAAYMRRSPATVREVLDSPAIATRVKALQLECIRKGSQLTEKMTELRAKAVGRALEKLEEASIKEAIEVAKFASDYHPDRMMTKLERKEETVTHHHHASGQLLDTLKQRHLTVVKSAPIPVEPISVETISVAAAADEDIDG